jgi:acyl carrier protein
MSSREVNMDVRGTVMEVFGALGFDTPRLRDETRLQEELDVDSTELVEVAVATEKRLGISLDSGRFLALQTVGEVVRFVESVKNGAGVPEGDHAANPA